MLKRLLLCGGLMVAGPLLVTPANAGLVAPGQELDANVEANGLSPVPQPDQWQGQLLAEGTPAEIRANPAVQQAYLGGSLDHAGSADG